MPTHKNITIIQGDLFDYAQSGYIIHQVNCQNVMGSGFAKNFFQHYPIIKKSYHEECEKFAQSQKKLLGHLQYVPLTKTLLLLIHLHKKNMEDQT